MISDPWIKAIDYYLDSARSPAGPRKSAVRGTMAYYSDAGNYGEPPGVWYCPSGWQAKDNSTVLPYELRRLAKGFDTKTGKPLSKQLPKNRRAGIDMCFSPPKDFSILFTIANRAGRRKLESILYKSVRKVLDQAMANGLIEVRQGKGGETRNPAEAIAAALFMHHSTRAGDPQLHIHALLMNMALRPDGTFGGINNEKFKDNRKLLDALFKFDLARELEMLGVVVESHEEHGFTVSGISNELREDFSERRMEIKLEADRLGIKTKNNAALAQMITLKTRKNKSDIPPISELNPLWQATLAAHGFEPNSELANFDRPAISRNPAEQSSIMKEVVGYTVGRMAHTKSYFDKRDLVTASICAAIGRVDDIAYMDKAMSSMANTGALVQIGAKDGKAILSTKAILDQERRIIAITKSRMVEPSIFDRSAVKAAIADTGLSQEQRDFLEDIFGPGGCVPGLGGAGTGKTRASAKVKEVCQASGLRLLLASPEWRAAGVLAKELKSEGRYSVDRLVNQHEAGKLLLGPKDVILCDEVGKMHRELAVKLLEIGHATGCKICLIGDTRQMSSVRAGDPLSLIYRAFPTRQIREIKRQKLEWMRAASMKSQAGLSYAALDDYARHGKVGVFTTTDDTIDQLSDAYYKSGGKAVAITANNRDVTAINLALRREAKKLGIITGQEISITAIPRGKHAKPVALKIGTGDRLITGARLDLGSGQVVENGTIFSHVEVDGDCVHLTTDDGLEFRTTIEQLQMSGRNGTLPHLQHAFCLTTMSCQGGTWPEVLWFATAESCRASYVAFTRHMQDLQIFISRETVRNYGDISLAVGASGLRDPDDIDDDRSDGDIIKIVGKSLSRLDEPRNALDVFQKPKPIVMMNPSSTLPAPDPGIASQM
jgi:conjugative relaxase-like TrwC/TraI family protein